MILKFLRFVNNKTINIQLFLIPTHIRAKIQLLVFFFFPKLTYLFSIKTAKLPNKNERFKKQTNKISEIKLFGKLKKFNNHCHLIMRNSKFDFNSIPKSHYKFLLNPLYVKDDTKGDNFIKTHKKKIFLKKDNKTYYVTSDGRALDVFIKRKLNIIFIHRWNKYKNKKIYLKGNEKSLKAAKRYIKRNKNSFIFEFQYQTENSTIYDGSGVAASLVFSQICKKLEIHNWNFYLQKNPKNLSTFMKINLLYPLSFRIKNNVFVEMGIYTWFYCYRLSKQKNIKINGFINEIIKDKQIIKKLKQIFYN